MAVSSPTSSSSSSRSSPLSPYFSSLPVMALRRKIVEKIQENRVTLIVGETGCGKSSQVPQFLLEENMAPILCTQPRRFAVVAVAKMVAKASNSELGGEVGYHIGHSKVLSERSKIVFKTAGVLLDEMQDKGLNALKYKVIILDEVHERSVESDLVLVCVKQFLMKNHDLRVVLMSATADITRYKDYFKDLGRGERVEVLAIPSSDQKTNFQRRVLYLEQVTRLLGMSSELSTYCPGRDHSKANPEINPEVQGLIFNLILHIHKNEPDIEKSILVFLPTYHSLEQQWYHLEPFSAMFKVHILHRSIDTEQALTSMRICKSHRKVILATNIAESSVTIPKVAYVIDSCRSLQVLWDAARKKDSAELHWVSRSQARQREGRTGRTCDGEVYRLVPSSFFNNLEEFESPAITKLSLRQQVLHICCTESKAINDARGLLAKAMDPPKPEVIEDALNVLLNIQALRTSPRGRYEPTFYGRLLASFPLSFDASILVVKFGEMGMLRDGILLAALMDTQPLPIFHPFGDEPLFLEYVHCYFGGESNKCTSVARREVVLIANLCAFQFWQRVFKDKHRLEHLKQVLVSDKTKDVMSMFPKIEEEWCDFHNIVQSSVYHVSEIYEDIISSLHRFRPEFLSLSDARPTYYKSYEFEHTCYLECQPCENTVPHLKEEDNTETAGEVRKCVSIPFVSPDDFHANVVARNMANIIREIRVQCTQDLSNNMHGAVGSDDYSDNGGMPVCVYFVKGFCSRGSSCMFSHTLQSKRPVCKFFDSLQGCRNGDSCLFSHDLQRQTASHSTAPCLPEDDESHTTPLLELLPTSSDGCILLFDDTGMHFASSIAGHYEPRRILATSSLSETLICGASLRDVRMFWGLHHPYQTIISKAGENPIPWNKVKCALWFLNPDSYGENSERQKLVLQNFFEYMAIRILGDALYEIRVVLTMNNIRFSLLQVEKLGRDCFFFLTDSFPHDATRFGELSDTLATQKPMIVSRPTSYVFDLHPPTDIQFGDYTSVLHEALHHK